MLPPLSLRLGALTHWNTIRQSLPGWLSHGEWHSPCGQPGLQATSTAYGLLLRALWCHCCSQSALLICHCQGISGKHKWEAQCRGGPCWPGGVREDAADTSPAPPVTSAGSQCSCSCASPWQSQLREPLWAPSLPQAPELIGTGNVTFYCNKIKPISFCQWALTSQIKRFWDPINLSNTALFVNLPLSFPFLFPTVLSVAHPLRGYIPIGNSALTWEVTTSNLLERPIQNCKCAMHTFTNQH